MSQFTKKQYARILTEYKERWTDDVIVGLHRNALMKVIKLFETGGQPLPMMWKAVFQTEKLLAVFMQKEQCSSVDSMMEAIDQPRINWSDPGAAQLLKTFEEQRKRIGQRCIDVGVELLGPVPEDMKEHFVAGIEEFLQSERFTHRLQ